MVSSCIVLKRKVSMNFIFLSAACSLMQFTIQCLCCDCLKVFIKLAGAGAIRNALAFFQVLNMEDNSRVNKSRNIWFKDMNSFLYIVVFCQCNISWETEEAKKEPLRWLKYGEIDVIVTFECVNAILSFLLYYYMRNFCNLIGLEQRYFSLIWNTYMWKLQTFCV